MQISFLLLWRIHSSCTLVHIYIKIFIISLFLIKNFLNKLNDFYRKWFDKLLCIYIVGYYDTIIFLHWPLRNPFLSHFGILWNSAFKVSISFLFFLCLSRLFFSQLFVRPHWKPFCLFAFHFLGGWFDCCLLYSVTNLHP